MLKAPWTVLQTENRVRQIVRQGGQCREQPAPRGAAQRKSTVVRIHSPGKAPEAVDKETVEAEQLDLLRGLDARAKVPNIVELPPLRRAEVVEPVALGVEVHLAEEGGQERQQNQSDEPRRVGDQSDGERDRRESVLRLPEDLGQQRGASRHLPSRPFEPVLLFAALELLQVERCGMLHETHAGEVAVEFREQAVDERTGPPEKVGHDGKAAFEHHETGENGQPSAPDPGRQAFAGRRQPALRHDLVDDELSDIEHHDRQRGTGEA